jgi:Flp pilus assembly protein TadD
LPIAEKAVALAPGVSSVTDTLGWIHFLMGNLVDAERVLTQAAKEAPPLAEVHVHLAQLYAKTSRAALAASSVKRALELKADLRTRKDVAQLLRELGIQ